jgi:hypothetical protein
MDLFTIIVGICLVLVCITTVEAILWSYTVFMHCRWSIRHEIPDRRNVSYNAVSAFSGITAVFCFASWIGFVYHTSVLSVSCLCTVITALTIGGFHILICHSWHLVSTFINIPLEYVPYTSRAFILLSNKILSSGYKINSIPLSVWEEFYSKAKEHKTLLINFLDKSPDLFWTKDESGRYTYINEATAKNLLMTEPADVLNKTSHQIAKELKDRGIDYTFSDYCYDTDEYTKRRRKPTLFYEYGNVGDKFLALRVMKAPIFNQDSKMVGIMGVGRNVTYHIETYNTIEELMDKKEWDKARAAFKAYKQVFESMKDVKDPEAFIKGLR